MHYIFPPAKADSVGVKTTPTKKEKKVGKKKEGKGSKGDGPPPESMQPPPGPLVALGRPKDKAVKRPRSVCDVSHDITVVCGYADSCHHDILCLFRDVCGCTVCACEGWGAK